MQIKAIDTDIYYSFILYNHAGTSTSFLILLGFGDLVEMMKFLDLNKTGWIS